jgi:hypothetical protein
MSSGSIDLLTSDDLTSDVAGLLAHGALVIAQSRDARERSRQWHVDATWHRQEAHDLLLRFSPHRLQPISGADSFAEEPERLRSALRAFASFGTPKTFVGLSRGATCDACGRSILEGEIEYELVADGHEMRLESDCYLLLVDELAKLQPRADAAS